jgi:uncharacterized membrane protein
MRLNITSFVSGIVFIALGVLFLLDRIGVIALTGRYIWPIVLIALGIALIFGGERRRHHHGGPGFRHFHEDDPPRPPAT